MQVSCLTTENTLTLRELVKKKLQGKKKKKAHVKCHMDCILGQMPHLRSSLDNWVILFP